MGVYIIKSKHSNWFKIGHHKVTASRPNVYFRYISRGFYSCIHPDSIRNRLGYNDVELLYFFKNLDTNIERRLHHDLKLKYQYCGEWYLSLDIVTTVDLIQSKYNGINEMPTANDLTIALNWRDEIKEWQRTKYNQHK